MKSRNEIEYLLVGICETYTYEIKVTTKGWSVLNKGVTLFQVSHCGFIAYTLEGVSARGMQVFESWLDTARRGEGREGIPLGCAYYLNTIPRNRGRLESM